MVTGEGPEQRLVVQLIGRVSIEGATSSTNDALSPRNRALLAYLALRIDRRSTRDQIIEAIWPETDIDVGRNRLSTALVAVRKALALPNGGTALSADRTFVWLDAQICNTDFEIFTKALRDSDRETDPNRIRQSLEHLFETASMPLAPDIFDDWIVPYQVQFDEQRDKLSLRLMSQLANGGLLIEARAVLQEYEKRDPDTATLREMRLLLSHVPQTQAESRDFGQISLIGREHDLEAVGTAAKSPGSVPIVISGIGGVGKSVLAKSFCERSRQRASFCEMDRALDPHSLLLALATEFRLLPDTRDLEPAVIRSLNEIGGVLVLDRFEHLPPSCDALVARIAQACPTVTILVTSRRALGVKHQKVVPIKPLETGPGGSAKRLFLERAADIRPDFAFSDEESTLIDDICARLGGLPLAIETIANRTTVLSIEDIERTLFNLDSGGTEFEFVVQESYKALGNEERAVWLRLGLFAGEIPGEAVTELIAKMGSRPVQALSAVGIFASLPNEKAGLKMFDLFRESMLKCVSATDLTAAEQWYVAFWQRWLTARLDEVLAQKYEPTGSKLWRQYRNIIEVLPRLPLPFVVNLIASAGYFWHFRGWSKGSQGVLRAMQDQIRDLNVHEQARYWQQVASVNRISLDDGEFRTALDKAYEALPYISDNLLRVQLLGERIWFDLAIGPKDFEALAQDADVVVRAYAEASLGWLHMRDSSSVQGLVHYRKAYDLAIIAHEPQLQLMLNNEIGYIHLRLGYLLQAESNLRQNAYAGRLFNPDAKPETELLAHTLGLLGRYAPAIDMLSRADKRASDNTHPVAISNIRQWSAMLYLDLGQSELALDMANSALDVLARWTNWDSNLGARAQIARAITDLGSPQEAMSVLEEARVISKGATVDVRALNSLDLAESVVHSLLDNYELGLASLRLVVGRSLSRFERLDMVTALESLAALAVRRDRELSAAAFRLSRALRARIALASPPSRQQATQDLATALGLGLAPQAVSEEDIGTMQHGLGGEYELRHWSELFRPSPLLELGRHLDEKAPPLK